MRSGLKSEKLVGPCSTHFFPSLLKVKLPHLVALAVFWPVQAEQHSASVECSIVLRIVLWFKLPIPLSTKKLEAHWAGVPGGTWLTKSGYSRPTDSVSTASHRHTSGWHTSANSVFHSGCFGFLFQQPPPRWKWVHSKL